MIDHALADDSRSSTVLPGQPQPYRCCIGGNFRIIAICGNVPNMHHEIVAASDRGQFDDIAAGPTMIEAIGEGPVEPDNRRPQPALAWPSYSGS